MVKRVRIQVTGSSREAPGARRDKIVDMVRRRGRVSVEDLARLLGASRETIRRDLARLVAERRIRKLHGSAALPDSRHEGPYAERLISAVREKHAIAVQAAALFVSGDTIFVDNGSTTLVFAQALRSTPGLTVITNGLEIGRQFAEGGARTFLLGGGYRTDLGETLGPLAIEQVARFSAAHAVLTVGALNASGAADFDLDEAQLARAMVRQAGTVTILADASKLARSSLFGVCTLDEIDRLVTDAPPPAELADALRRSAVELIVAGTGEK